MNLTEAIENSKMLGELFDTFIEIVKPYTMDDKQIEQIIDCKYSILADFDTEISNAINLSNINEQIQRRKLLCN